MKHTVFLVLAWTGRILVFCIILAVVIAFLIVVGIAAGMD